MVALLNPAALLALLGLLVPVAIHLWNRRPGREVAVGSLRWLAAGANRRLRNLKLEQLWLLLLRAALLAVLAVAVAGPVWRTPRPASRGVVLLSAEAAGLPALVGLKPTIDSLRRRGYALRWLAAGFAPVPGRTWRQVSAGQAGAAADSVAAQAAAESRNPAFAWARVQQATAAFPGQPLLVVTSAGLRQFGGSHTALPPAVTWQALPDTTTITWLATAAQVGSSLQLLVGRSSETQTAYRLEKVAKQLNGQPMPVAGLAPLRLQPGTNGASVLVPAGGASKPAAIEGIEVEVAPLVIEIYATPAYAADSRYLEAGLRAAGGALPIPPRLHRATARPKQLSAPWTIWLSDEPLPADWQREVAQNARQVWRAAVAPGVADTAHLAAPEADAAAVTVFRRDARPPAPSLETVWADAQGRPILSRQRLGRGSMLQLHTRLNPAWSELADDPQLPARLLALLRPEPTSSSTPPTQLARLDAAHDRRTLASAQLPDGLARTVAPPAATAAFSAITPAAAVAATTATPTAFRTTDLRPWLVLLAGLLLLLERLLAARRAAVISLASE